MNIKVINYTSLGEGIHREILALRNSERIRAVSINKSIIDFESHIKWVRGLAERDDCRYYAVLQNEAYLGTVSLTLIDREKGDLEWGVAFKESALFVPSLIIYEMIEKVFLEMKMKTISLTVQADNHKVVEMNKKFGFAECGKRRLHGVDYLAMSLSNEKWSTIRLDRRFSSIQTMRRKTSLEWEPLC